MTLIEYILSAAFSWKSFWLGWLCCALCWLIYELFIELIRDEEELTKNKGKENSQSKLKEDNIK